MTTDAWSSLSKQSYITVTAHLIDDDVKLHKFVLDTSEMNLSHTSENVLAHVKNVMDKFNLDDNVKDVTVNYNSTNNDAVNENDDGVDYLRSVDYYSDDEDEDNAVHVHESDETQMSQTQMTDMTDSQIFESPDFDLVIGGGGQLPQSSSDQEEIRKSLTMVSDNASDIAKALRDLGGFEWLGCAGHHLNLVVKEGFKKHLPAAKLLKKCKSIIQLAHKSLPLMYDIKKYQQELDLPIHMLLQELTTRWWSILGILDSLIKNRDPVFLALSKANKVQMMLGQEEISQVEEIIKMLKYFKLVGEKLGKEKEVTISMIIPMFNYISTHVINHNPSDSNFMQTMKAPMRKKTC